MEDAVGPLESDGDQDARVAYKKARMQGVAPNKTGGAPKRGGVKVRGAGQTLHGFNRRSGLRNGCYLRGGEFHFAPKCPRGDTPIWGSKPDAPGAR